MENRVYEIEIELATTPRLAAEQFRIVKFYRPGRWSYETILEEHQFLHDLKRAELSVIAPEGDEGRTLHICPSTGIFYALFPKCGGRSVDELTQEQIPMIARLLARAHSVGAAHGAPHRLQLTPKIYGEESLAAIIKSGLLPVSVAEQYAGSVGRFLQLIGSWFDGLNVHRIHGDCHLGNVIFNSSGPALVDFDDMLVGPAIQDLWMLIDTSDQRLMEIFVAAYEGFRRFPMEQLRLIEPLRGLRMIHYSAWIAKRWQDQTFPLAFPHFGTQQYWMELAGDLNDLCYKISSGGAVN